MKSENIDWNFQEKEPVIQCGAALIMSMNSV